MMQSLKYGLMTAAGYLIILTAMFALTTWIEDGGLSCISVNITPFYVVLTVAGFLVAFFAGYRLPHIFSRMVDDYKSEYPDVPEKYVSEICRGKLLKSYSFNLAIVCLITAPLLSLNRKPTIATWCLFSIGIISTVAYIQYKRKFKNL